MIKKILATTATLLLAFGSVALSGTIAMADDAVADAPAAVVEAAPEATIPPSEAPAPEATPVEAPPAAEPAVAEPGTVEVAPDESTTTESDSTGSEGTGSESGTSARSATVETESTVQAAAALAGVGIIGTQYPNSPASNQASYWETKGPDQAICYKHDSDGGEHGTVTNGGKTVVLNTFNQSWPGDHWELLIIKAGTVDVVTIHPSAGVEYAAYDYKDVSHWIVCKGIKAASAEVVVNPGTCTSAGTVSGGATVNATFANPTYSGGNYSIVATAQDGAVFPAGAGVSNDGTKKTFTGVRPAQLTGAQCLASASVQVTQPTCDAPGTVVGINPVNASFGAATYNNGTYTIVATATGSAKFTAGAGVSANGLTKTFTGPYQAQLPASSCVASAAVSVHPATCGADGSVTGINPVNATFGAPQYSNGTYTIIATATGIAKFAAGAGVSADGKTTTFTGPYQTKLTDAQCVASASLTVAPATCTADGYVVPGTTQNATFGEVTYANGQYTVVATATGVATFPAGAGVSDDGTMKTFTGPYAFQTSADDCLASASVTVAPATCTADGYVVPGTTQNATFGEVTYANGQYTVVATATGVATFPAGAGVSDDGTTKTFTGPVAAQLGEADCVASAAVTVSPATCEADGSVMPGTTVNATFGEVTYADGQYSITATATGVALFAAGDGVSADRTTKTFTGSYGEQTDAALCVASAAVTVEDATCFADGYVVAGTTVNATFGEPTYSEGQYSITATVTGVALFAAGDGVSADRTAKTFTGPIQARLSEEECLPTLDLVTPEFGQDGPTCTTLGSFTLGGTDVLWFKDGVSIPAGTHALPSGVDAVITAEPAEGHGFALEEQTEWIVSFAAPTGPCGNSTPPSAGGLAHTGSEPGSALVAVAAGTLLLGVAGVIVARRRRVS